HSAVATFYAPSDPSSIRGVCREHIHSTPTWRKHGPRRDCVFMVETQRCLIGRSWPTFPRNTTHPNWEIVWQAQISAIDVSKGGHPVPHAPRPTTLR
ncbi:hypothetical protein DFH08DRAFT_704491, partial [Mycena albidolilacea]